MTKERLSQAMACNLSERICGRQSQACMLAEHCALHTGCSLSTDCRLL